MSKENTRILRIINHYTDGNKKAFADLMEVSPQHVQYWVNSVGLGRKVASQICEKLPDININWLLTGEGNMFIDASIKEKEYKPKQKVEYSIEDLIKRLDDQENRAGKYQEQIDKLLSIIDRLTGGSNSLGLNDNV